MKETNIAKENVKRVEFDLNKVYNQIKSPKEIAKWIRRLKDKELMFIVIPTSKKTCDILIKDVPK